MRTTHNRIENSQQSNYIPRKALTKPFTTLLNARKGHQEMAKDSMSGIDIIRSAQLNRRHYYLCLIQSFLSKPVMMCRT